MAEERAQSDVTEPGRGPRVRRVRIEDEVPRISRRRALLVLLAALGGLVVLTFILDGKGVSPDDRREETQAPALTGEPLDPARIEEMAERLLRDGQRLEAQLESSRDSLAGVQVPPEDSWAVPPSGAWETMPPDFASASAVEADEPDRTEQLQSILAARRAPLVPPGVTTAAPAGGRDRPGVGDSLPPMPSMSSLPSPAEMLRQLQRAAPGLGAREMLGDEPHGAVRPTDTVAQMAMAPGASAAVGTGRVLARGTFIPLVLRRGIDSDVPGPVEAMVTRDVRDWTGTQVLVPRGSILYGAQDGRPAAGDGRLLIRWSHARRADGSLVHLSATAAGLDGTLGATGQIDRHWMSRVGSAVVFSLVGAGVQIAQPERSGARLQPGELAAGELGLSLGRLAEQSLRQGLERGPTIRLEAGARLGAVVDEDLVVQP